VAITVVNAPPCYGTSWDGDFDYEFSPADNNPTLTFIPSGPGVGDPTCILYYGTNPSSLPGYFVTPNIPYTLNASMGTTIYFYYTYSFPGFVEKNNSANKDSYVIGSCKCEAPELSFSVTDVSSAGGSDGAIDLSVINGSPPYTYNWSDGSTTEDLSGLTTGFYSVTVTDSELCTESGIISVDEPLSCSSQPAITNLSVSNIKLTRAQLNWESIPSAYQYEIRGRKTAPTLDNNYTYIKVSSSALSYVAKDLKEGASYEWQVRAVCDSLGLSFNSWSGLNNFTMGVCENPGNTQSSNITNSSATLSWDPIAYPDVLGYKLIGGVLGSFNISYNLTGASNTTFFASSLPSSTSYNWGIVAGCTDPGLSFKWSNSASATINYFTTLGVEMKTLESENSSGSFVFPNPAHGLAYLYVDDEFNRRGHRDNTQSAQIEVMDVHHRLIKKVSSELNGNGYYTIDVSGLESGFYFVVVKGERHEVIKLVVE
ncbi:MAG: hypothetical protein HKN92_05840, partial [Chitinophagales bacterium]|nr:hypothetical protein [Chitinophagales bacterium]